jgi:hypothetical protein
MQGKIYDNYKNSTMKKDQPIFRDLLYEERTRQQLTTAKAAMQEILNNWLTLDLGPCFDLHELVFNPRAVYDRTVNRMIKVPETKGPFKMNPSQFREQLVLPDPSKLIKACNAALKVPYTSDPELWLVNGDIIELSEAESEALIDSQSIYLSDPIKIELVEEMIKLCELLNSLNSKTSGEMLPNSPASNEYFSGKFILRQEFDRSPFKISVSPDYLRQLVQR